LTISIIGAVIFLWLLAHLVFSRRSKRKYVKVIAHRGGAGLAGENTVTAVRRSLAQQANMIEVDIHRTKDGELVCLHDASVDRITTGTGMIKDLLWTEIAGLTTKEQADHIPRLIDIIQISKKRSGLKLVIEIKNSELYPGIEQDLVATITATYSNKDVIIISFDFDSITKVNKLNPDLKTGILFKHPFFSVKKKLSREQVISVFWLSVVVDPSFVYRAHKNGNELWVWTVNSLRIANLLQLLGVDAITTDYPQKNRLP